MPGPPPPGRLVLTGNCQSPFQGGLCSRGVGDAAPYNTIQQKHLLTGHTHTGQQVLIFYALILICKVAEGLCLLDDLALQHLG